MSTAGVDLLCWCAPGPCHGEVLLRCLYTPDRIVCLKLTKDGHPQHPLYLAGDTKLITFSERAERSPRSGRTRYVRSPLSRPQR